MILAILSGLQQVRLPFRNINYPLGIAVRKANEFQTIGALGLARHLFAKDMDRSGSCLSDFSA